MPLYGFGRRLQGGPGSLAARSGRHVDVLERVQDIYNEARIQSAAGNQIKSEGSILNAGTLTTALLLAQGATPPLIKLAGSDAMPLAIAAAAQEQVSSLDTASAASNLFINNPVVADPVSQVSDHRTFKIDRNDLATMSGRSSRQTVAKSFSTALPYGVALKSKSSATLCIRRNIRRGVLLALGQGGGYHRKPRRNSTSNIWC
ncbi:hypothetical protein [Microvirus D_HF4_329]|nr:hypothetical protein [Microvirus D_HF4_329]